MQIEARSVIVLGGCNIVANQGRELVLTLLLETRECLSIEPVMALAEEATQDAE